jgi:hypothetical protein
MPASRRVVDAHAVANVELDTTATALPPTVYGAWVLRGDQADWLAEAVREEAPRRGERGGPVMLVEARILGRSASAWVSVDDGDIHEHLRKHGHELLARLGVDARRSPYVLADMRHLDEQGRPPARNAACRCGSGRKASRCAHPGPPRLFTTAWLFLDQGEWDRFVADEDDFARREIPAMSPGRARIGMRRHTLADTSLATLTTDFAPGSPPFLPWTLLTETASTLSELVVDQVPFLRDAKVWLTVARPDRQRPASHGPARAAGDDRDRARRGPRAATND